MNVLLIYGGCRIGDCIHAIPLLKELKNRDINIHWIHGSYEQQVCKLLRYLGLVDRLISTPFIVGKRGDACVNPDMSSIKGFLNYVTAKEKDIFEILQYQKLQDTFKSMSEYDAIITPQKSDKGFNGLFESTKDIGVDFSICPWASADIPNVIIDGYEREDDFIGCQPASVSPYKTYDLLYKIEYPGEVKSFGFEGETPIQNALNVHGKDLAEVYNELQTCAMVVSTHSAIGLLAYYLNIPVVFISFWKNLAKLARRSNVIQLEQPNLSELQDAINTMYIKCMKGVVNA